MASDDSRIDITEAERGAVIVWLQRRARMCLDEVQWHRPIRGMWLRHMAATFRASALSIKECAHLAHTLEQESAAFSRARLSLAAQQPNTTGEEG